MSPDNFSPTVLFRIDCWYRYLMASILVLKNGTPGVKITLGETNRIGRSSACEIQLLDPKLSRFHAAVEFRDGDYWVKDLNSRNGTFLAAQRVTAPIRLNDEDEIRLGDQSLIFNPPLDLLYARGSDKTLYIVEDGVQSSGQSEPLRPSALELDRAALKSIFDLTCEVAAALELPSLLATLLDRFIAHFEADRGFVLVTESQGKKLKPVAIRTEKAAIAVSRSLIQAAVRQKSPILVHNAIEDVSFVGAKSVLEHSLRSVMVVPLWAGKELLGVIQLDRAQTGAFDQSALAKLSLLARSAALAIQNARRFDLEQRKNEALASREVAGTVFIGEDPGICELLAQTRKVAQSPARVLITGESGTGKELIARMIHSHSRRADGPWVAINCGAMPAHTLESELFGHEKGAFTSAVSRKRGCFELADGGTLFLDEVAELTLAMQVKLLRVLQEGSFYRLGSETPIDVDVRIVAATNQQLEQLVEQQKFRQDLYYRLNVISLHLPPLRKRSGDIEQIMDYFVGYFGRQMGKRVPSIAWAAKKLLTAYPWPGNVRELRNVAERLTVLNDKPEIEPADLPAEIRDPKRTTASLDTGTTLKAAMIEVERQMLQKAIETHRGKKVAICKQLGISRPTLDKKLAEYRLEL